MYEEPRIFKIANKTISKLCSFACILTFSWRTLIIWWQPHRRFLFCSFPHGHSVPACANCISGSRVAFSSITDTYLVSEYILWTNFPHVEIWWAPEKGNNLSLDSILHPKPCSGPECILHAETLHTWHLVLPSRLSKSQPGELQRPHQPSKGDFHNPHTINWQIKLWSHDWSFLVTFCPL